MPNEFMDITAPKIVEIQIRHDGKVVWIHINGETVLRICQIGDLRLTDDRMRA